MFYSFGVLKQIVVCSFADVSRYSSVCGFMGILPFGILRRASGLPRDRR